MSIVAEAASAARSHVGAPLVELEDLTVRFGAQTAVDRVSLTIAPGEILGLVGESGSGKTMLGRAMLRLTPPGAIVAGGIRIAAQDVTALSARGLTELRGGMVGLVFQEPLTALNPALTIERQLTEGLIYHRRLRRGEAMDAAEAMLRRVGLTSPEALLRLHPHQLSGGMRQRVMLAAVMLLRPRLLIADEPTTALDSIAQHQVISLMVELARDAGTAVLMISHNLGIVAGSADRLAIMRAGRIVETGTCADILGDPAHEYTRRLLDAVPKRRALPPPKPHADSALDVTDLEIAYPERRGWFRQPKVRQAVSKVSLSIRAGETLALVGQSGSGKSSLARAVLGLVAYQGGAISVDGQDLTWMSRHARARAMQMIFQDPFSSLDPRMRVSRLIGEGLLLDRTVTAAEGRRRVTAILDDVGLGADFASRFPHQLSGGQRQRVAIARALVGRPRLIIADEPVAALDVTVQAQILELFRSLQARYGFACLLITHDIGVVEEVAHRVVVFKNGQVVEEGDRDTVIAAPADPYTRLLLEAAPGIEADGRGYRLFRRFGSAG